MKIFNKYFLVPLILTLLGFFMYDSCADIVCLFPGNGFPLGYYYNNNFLITFFIIDFIIFIIIYFILLNIFKFLKNKFKF
ncbi:TPA: hypothetical protein DIC38_00050 [Candidatus Nomurabacteria bacterium]|nr:MAG: hypothetical protein O210_OD1C00001G0717 [Parcubacteria bacterium RAAC4_OD1_1]HCY26067.1 hypothetical protein [Candidatus Nomurabacteria bacterium]